MAAWPTELDLRNWLGEESVSATSNTVVTEAFDSANELIRDRISTTLFNSKASDAGIVIDDTDAAYDAAVLAAWCPAYVRTAILIRSAAIYTRRDSANGTIAFGEFATKVAKMDPDVNELLVPVVGIPFA